MASKLLITALLIFAAALVSAQARGNFFVGNTFGAHLIYHETHSKYAIPFIVRDEDFTVTGVDNEIIEAISVSDLEGKGLSYVKSGGIGQHNVTIHLESQRSHGYKFLVEVYAI